MRSNPLAYALAFAAAVLWPVYSVLSRIHGGGFNGVGLFVLLTAVVLWGQWLAVDTVPCAGPGAWLEVLAIGASTAIGYSCWEHGIQRGNLAVMAAGSYFAPCCRRCGPVCGCRCSRAGRSGRACCW
jgi:drug/metabolite transporter (DMT)-like permease